MLLVTKSHHERDEEKAVDKNQAGDIGSVSSTTYTHKKPGYIISIHMDQEVRSQTAWLHVHLFNYHADSCVCVVWLHNADFFLYWTGF